MSAVLGVNCFSHDTAACLVVDGDVVALGEQERFNREQHTKAMPDDAIAFCLAEAGLRVDDLDAVAFAHHVPRDLARGSADAVRRAAPKRLAAQIYVDGRLLQKERTFRRRWGRSARVVHVGHHQAHAASAYFASPFDSAAVLTIDRGGDFLSTTLNVGEGNRLRTLSQVANPHSLGEIYSGLTAHLGFRPNADEGKVMGLAPYGRDHLTPALRDLVRLTGDGLFRINLGWFRYQREGSFFSPRALERFGPARVPGSPLTEHHEDLAFGVQALIEEACLHVASHLQRTTGRRTLCLAGGVALNSVMNARLLREAGFEDIFIQPASSDAGNALGAALWTWHQVLGHERSWTMRHAFLGPSFSESRCAAALSAMDVPFRRVADAEDTAAERLASGQVVGWFQGRAEVGPRALGARSILADPRRPEMKDIVNERVKRREPFRPFAPSVLDDHGGDYFDGYRRNPFMLLVQSIRPERRDAIPAVTHVDGTGRVQSVDPRSNPSFARLIDRFHGRTGVPVVLNTSLNLAGEPIVHRPEEAVRDFLDSDMDSLLLGCLLAEKPSP